jgi:hypothetical protein
MRPAIPAEVGANSTGEGVEDTHSARDKASYEKKKKKKKKKMKKIKKMNKR